MFPEDRGDHGTLKDLFKVELNQGARMKVGIKWFTMLLFLICKLLMVVLSIFMPHMHFFASHLSSLGHSHVGLLNTECQKRLVSDIVYRKVWTCMLLNWLQCKAFCCFHM